MVKRYILPAAVFLALSFLRTSAQTISVYASTDTTEYKVGDYINYTIEVIHDKDISVDIPDVKDSISVLEFIKAYKPVKETGDRQIKEVYNYVFSKYDSANVIIPSFTISYLIDGNKEPRKIKTNEVKITVRTIEVNAGGDIMDVKAPVKIPFDWVFLIILFFIVIVIAAALIWGYRYYRRKKSGQVVTRKIIKIPAHKIAIKELMNLEEKKLWQQGKIKEYHSDITGIIRKYFESRFSLSAMEMTSSEVLDNLGKISEAGEIFDLTRNFLNNADLVKFAKFEPMPSVNEEMMKQAYEIVKTTIPDETDEKLLEVSNVE